MAHTHMHAIPFTCQALSDQDLPASKFDKEFRQSVNFDDLENAALAENKTFNLDEWKRKFLKELTSSFEQISEKWPYKTHEKRCRDFNYHADYTMNLISLLKVKGPHGKMVHIHKDNINSIKEQINRLFKKYDKFECASEEKRYTLQSPLRKDLDNFCENRDHLAECVTSKKQNCKRLVNFVNSKYYDLFSYDTCIVDSDTTDGKLLHISNNCSLYDIPKTFSYPACDNFEIPERIQSIPYCPMENLSLFSQLAAFVSDYISYIPNLAQIRRSVVYICLIILGISIPFLILYRLTHLGNVYQKEPRNDEGSKNTYDGSEEMLQYSSEDELSNMPSREYLISYLQMQNEMESESVSCSHHSDNSHY
ncbi:PIR protein [Plasmodium vivax]|uniref:VIR protein n=1 Tax=Plasmodium vivax TaxID=5855 RepID=A0A1G4GT11_PLAVI|nr:PIR protein [Plasmodium vivax]SCO65744.1 VIR protein [Plasmodium vivax]